jgi:hypothetical protein
MHWSGYQGEVRGTAGDFGRSAQHARKQPAIAGHRVRYPVAALVVYVALGVALGMVGWALFLHGNDGGDTLRGKAPSSSPTSVQQQRSPSRENTK